MPRLELLPMSANIEDRRDEMPLNETEAELADLQAKINPIQARERWQGKETPTERDIDFVLDNMTGREDHREANEILFDFFNSFPKYTRALLISEGRNPAITPDEWAMTPDEWDATQRDRSTQIDPESHPGYDDENEER